MRKWILWMCGLLVLGLVACQRQEVVEEPSSLSESQVAENEDEKQSEKILVVYYSTTGSTKQVAQYIANTKDADLFEIQPVEPYSQDDLNWRNQDSRVVYEHDHLETRNMDLIQAQVPNWESYDTVFIGYPIWWGIAAWPLDRFIQVNDFGDKIVIPFCTSSSSGLGDSARLLEEKSQGGKWAEGHRFSSRASEAEIKDWLDTLKLW